MLSCHVCSIPFLLRRNSSRFSTYPIQILRQNYVVILHTFFQLLTDVLFILVSTGRTCTQDWGKAEKRANLTNCKVIQVELCKRLFRTSWNKQCNCKAYKSAGNRYKVWGGDSSEAMGAAREGKMEENSLNKYNRSPPSPPILLPSSEIRYLLCVLQHSPNRERTNLLLRTPSVFFLFLVTLLLTDFHTNVPILIFRFCTCVLFYLLFFF